MGYHSNGLARQPLYYPHRHERDPDVKEPHMCSPVRCNSCGKVTWQGCGDHVDQVMSQFPKDQHCTCPR